MHVSLEPLDWFEENETIVMPLVVKGINIYELTLPFRRLWNYTLLAHGCEEHPLTEPTILSKGTYNYDASCLPSKFIINSGTHDVQNVSILSTGSPGQIRVTANLIFGSTAIGLLIIVYSLTDYSDIHYHFAQVDEGQIDDNIMGLTGGLYQVLVYVVEENRLPFQRPAITPNDISIIGKILKINFIICHQFGILCVCRNR